MVLFSNWQALVVLSKFNSKVVGGKWKVAETVLLSTGQKVGYEKFFLLHSDCTTSLLNVGLPLVESNCMWLGGVSSASQISLVCQWTVCSIGKVRESRALKNGLPVLRLWDVLVYLFSVSCRFSNSRAPVKGLLSSLCSIATCKIHDWQGSKNNQHTDNKSINNS